MRWYAARSDDELAQAAATLGVGWGAGLLGAGEGPRGKRLLDVVGALLLLFLAVPIVVVCALAVRLQDPGPALFRQARGGLGGRSIDVVKLRTMWAGSELIVVVPDLMSDSGLRREWEESRRGHDPRVIRLVGPVLRRSSVDELPQLWNVLRGDMSLVGPRPLELELLARLPADFVRTRATVKPGLTGLWQVSGRNSLDVDHLIALRHRVLEPKVPGA